MFVLCGSKKSKKKGTTKRRLGRGFAGRLLNRVANKVVDKLPFELHIPGYQYCGPGTRLAKRLQRGDRGINPLDAACREHDIAYTNTNTDVRRGADKVLASKAWGRVTSKDASLGERAAALAVTGIMKGKARMGAGHRRVRRKVVKIAAKRRRRRATFQRPASTTERATRAQAVVALRKAVQRARQAVRGLRVGRGLNLKDIAQTALHAALRGIPKLPWIANVLPFLRLKTFAARKGGSVRTGGFLPLIPLFAGLSALGGLAGGAAGIASAVNKAGEAKHQLSEARRHNATMEAIALRRGSGLYLRRRRPVGRHGSGLYLRPWRSGGKESPPRR